jgi:hypothetical protein
MLNPSNVRPAKAFAAIRAILQSGNSGRIFWSHFQFKTADLDGRSEPNALNAKYRRLHSQAV